MDGVGDDSPPCHHAHNGGRCTLSCLAFPLGDPMKSIAYDILPGLLGGLVGGFAGYLLLGWVVKQGYDAPVLVGAFAGLGCGMASRTDSNPRGILCAILATIGGLLAQWKLFHVLVHGRRQPPGVRRPCPQDPADHAGPGRPGRVPRLLVGPGSGPSGPGGRRRRRRFGPDQGPTNARRAARTRSRATSGSGSITVRWPIFRPGAAVLLP